jgi:hypothetical protein
MWVLLTIAVILAIGYGAWAGILWLSRVYEDKVPDHARDVIYRTTKNFPQRVVDFIFATSFLFSLGGTLFHWLIRPFLGDRFVVDTSWAPSALFGSCLLLLIGYWGSPEKPKEPFQARGRELKTSRPGTEQLRGRTIRSYRDLE